MGAGASTHAGSGEKPRAEGLGGERQNLPVSRDLFGSAVVDVPSSSGVKHVVILGSDFVNNFAVFPSRSTGADLRTQASLSSPPGPRDPSFSDEFPALTVSNEGTLAAGQAAQGESPFVVDARGDSPPVGEGHAAREAWVAARVLEQKKEFFTDMRSHLKSALVEQMDVLKQGLRACPLTAAAASVASATAGASLRQVEKAFPEDRTVSPFYDQQGDSACPRPVCHDEQLAVLRCYNRQSKQGESEGNADYLSCRSVVADLRACSERVTQLGPHARPQN
ncbi:UNVERIFIED_CONTAM: hypothetical protein HHA_319510 [Hammondia hammondi]|eukprot:XP_008885207.1 hypothetical protein HHA_319510 [Hammondia hammondi]